MVAEFLPLSENKGAIKVASRCTAVYLDLDRAPVPTVPWSPALRAEPSSVLVMPPILSSYSSVFDRAGVAKVELLKMSHRWWIMGNTVKERIMVVRLPVIQLQSHTPLTSPFSITKAKPPVPLPVTLSNDPAGPAVGLNGQ